MTIERLGLLLIILFASFLYFYKLGSLPNSLSDDEATVGYNAYSILQTGKDEFGKAFPLAFRFFGAYTPPLYVYLVVPVVKLFGLNVVSIRLLSGVFTIIGIFITYGFANKLGLFKSRLTPALGAFIFAISPWVIYYARVGYEVTAGYIIFAAGAYFLWVGLVKKRLSLTGLLLLSLSIYAAHTERLLVPVFLATTGVFFAKEIFSQQNRRQLLAVAIILTLTQLPNFYLMTTKAFWVKGETFGDFNLTRIAGEFGNQYLTYLSPRALFSESADINLQHTAPEIGLFYSWLIAPFLIGLYQLYWKKGFAGGKYLLLMLLTAPIPGALSGHFISVQRVLSLIIPLTLIMALGFDALLMRIRPVLLLPLLALLSAFSLLLWWRSYFVFLPKERFVYWSYGYEQMAKVIKDNPDKKYIIDAARAATVYDSLLFHLVYPPAEFQKQFPTSLAANYYTNPRIDINYKFAAVELRGIVWENDPLVDQILVGDPLTISADQAREHFLTLILEIHDPNEKAILIGYQTNPTKKKLDNLTKKKR